MSKNRRRLKNPKEFSRIEEFLRLRFNRMRPLRTRCLVLAVTAAALSVASIGCVNINLGDAANLAQTGNRAASAYASSVRQTSAQIDHYVEAQYLVAPLRNLPPPDLEPPEKVDCARSDLNAGGNIQCVQRALAARAVMMSRLADTYQSFGALASYGAQSDMKSSLQSLDGAVNSFAAAVGSSGVPAVAGALITDVGGIIAVDVQKVKVKRTSEVIRTKLGQIVPLLEKERATLDSLQTTLVTDAGVTASVLWRHGIGAPDPILADNLGAFGLAYKPGSYTQACKNLGPAEQAKCRRNLNDAIRQVVLLRARRQARDQLAIINSNTQAIKDLIAAHQQLEAGQGVNLATISQQIATLQSIVNDVNSARGQKPSSK